jgi:hypothetical protein
MNSAKLIDRQIPVSSEHPGEQINSYNFMVIKK